MTNQIALRGLFVLAVALYFFVQAPGYSIGTLTAPKPGFFPLVVSGLLLVLGSSMLVRARLETPEPVVIRLRNVALIVLSLVGFTLLTHFANMLIAIVAMTFLSSLAGPDFTVRRAATIAAVLCVIAVAMKHGLGINLPLY